MLRPYSFRTALICVGIIGCSLWHCARFRIEELQPEAVFSFPVTRADAENPRNRLQLMENGRVPYNLPLRPAFDGSRAYLADPARRMIRVYFTGNENPDSLLVPPGTTIADEDLETVTVRGLGIPGWTAATADHLYVQSFAAVSESPPTPDQTVENRPSNERSILRRSASRILHLDPDNDFAVLGILGVDGYNSEAFPAIDRLTADDNGLLYVLYRDAENSPVLAIFQDGRRIGSYAPPADFPGEEDARRYHAVWEDIAPGQGGDFALYSLALRRKGNYDLVQRIILRRAAGEDSRTVELLRSDDPADYFMWSRNDGGFYLRNSEEDGSRMLFKIFSPDGEYLNNRLIVLPGLRASWRDTYLDIDERIFSSRLYLGRFELYEWK